MNMKRLLSIIAALTVFVGSVRADEGMWLLPLLQKMNAQAIQDLGCELTPERYTASTIRPSKTLSYSSEADVPAR